MAANNSRRVAGIASLTIDGSVYALVDGLTWSPSNVSRETMVGLSGVHGYKEMPVAGFISATIRDGGITVEDFNGMTASTVTAVQANGKMIIGTTLWCVSALEVNSAEGTFEVRFEGTDIVEVLS